MTEATPDLWMTAQDIADARLPGMPTSKRLVNRLAADRGWRTRDGLWRYRRGESGGSIEWHPALFPAAAQRVLAAREVIQSGKSRKLLAVETAERLWTEGSLTKSEAVDEAAFVTGASQSSIWRWWRQVEGVPALEREAILDLRVDCAKTEAEAIASDARSVTRHRAQESGLAGFELLPPEQQAVAETRRAIVGVVEALAGTRGISPSAARAVFVAGWSSGSDDFGITGARAIVGKVSARTLGRWSADFEAGGLSALAPKHGRHLKGRGVIDSDPDIRTLVEGMLAQFSDVQISTVHEAIKARFKARKIPSKRTVQRWVSDWKDKNAAAYLLASDPDAFKNKARLVVGSASEHVLRLNQLWEMDGTPNDVMLADGKRHGIVGAIDVYSRRLKLLVVKTQTSAGVAACLRKSLIAWGVPELIKMDNGSDYKSKHIARVCAGLEIEQKFCPPFSPEKKPHIERAFHTFSHDLVQLLAGYIGHSVEQRKKIEARRTFAKRLMDRDAEAPEISLTAEELQEFCDRWCDAVYAHRDHSTLRCSPFVQAQSWQGPVRSIENERALDVLLMAAPGDNGTRTVTKRGIQIDKFHYVDPELQRHWKQRVQVRLDEEDWGRVLVLSESGSFICWAICPERAGVSRAEAAAYLAVDRKKIESEFRKVMSKAKRDSAASTVAADILASYEENAENVVAFPKPATTHTTPSLDAGAVADAAKRTPALTERRTDISIADVAALDDARPRSAPETSLDRFLRWERIDAGVRDGQAVSETEAAFWRSLPKTPEFAAIKEAVEEDGRAAVFGKEVGSDRHRPA